MSVCFFVCIVGDRVEIFADSTSQFPRLAYLYQTILLLLLPCAFFFFLLSCCCAFSNCRLYFRLSLSACVYLCLSWRSRVFLLLLSLRSIFYAWACGIRRKRKRKKQKKRKKKKNASRLPALAGREPLHAVSDGPEEQSGAEGVRHLEARPHPLQNVQGALAEPAAGVETASGTPSDSSKADKKTAGGGREPGEEQTQREVCQICAGKLPQGEEAELPQALRSPFTALRCVQAARC
ncbi:hypothetical protein TCSYLVIO_004676 [Trypanosoma cruzi]|nr:hypothetical protein TCSYLVIO_004676 [Trypanosoma cruzi]